MNLSQRFVVVVLAGVAMLVCVIQINNSSKVAQLISIPKQPKKSVGLVSGSISLLGPGRHWQLAGVEDKVSQLKVTNTSLAIVKQDGSPGQDNPPVNLYGTHIAKSGDFSITTTISQLNGAVRISLYGKPPIVSDEFRVEEGTLDMKIDGNIFTAMVSDQTHGKNAFQFQQPILPASSHKITVADTRGRLSFSIDDQKSIRDIADNSIFETGEIYVGMDVTTSGGSFVVDELAAAPQKSGKVDVIDTRQLFIEHDPNGFAALANQKRTGFFIGAAIAPGPMFSDTTYRNLLGNFNAISVENALKMQTVQPLQGKFNFAEGDAEVSMARKAGMKVHGHAIVFGEANPAWVQDIAKNHPELLEKVMVDHITKVVNHYKGKISSWDINEILADYDTTPGLNGLRQNIWYKAIGPSYVAKANQAVHAADPSAEVWLNDFGMESDDDRFNQMVNQIKLLKAQNILVYGVGLQSHLDEGDMNASDTHIDITKLRGRIKTLEALGVKVRISELDVSNESEYSAYGDVINACINEPNCVGVTFWGVMDKYSSSASVDSKGKIFLTFRWRKLIDWLLRQF